MRVRKAASVVEHPSTPDPTLLWYSRAIGVMKKRPFSCPISWRFQGAVHGWDRASDPYRDEENDPPPSYKEQVAYFNQCQHGSWFFLPWHRMYLYHFEQIVADAVVEAGGEPGWTLPYWDYTREGLSRKLPWSFRNPTWPDGEENHLYVEQRAIGMNDGTSALQSEDVDVSPALRHLRFSYRGEARFGGPPGRFHKNGSFGALETLPHNAVHMAVGGQSKPYGFMSSIEQTALDPVFVLHHANLDRLWEVWLNLGEGRANPTEDAWLRWQEFSFYDHKRVVKRSTAASVVDTRKLGYTYDKLIHEGETVPEVGYAALPDAVARRPSTLLGATDAPLQLGSALRRVSMATSPASANLTDEVRHAQVLLRLEHVRALANAGVHDVYINLPEGALGEEKDRLHAGRIALFGSIGGGSRAHGHALSGNHIVQDITHIYHDLLASGRWDPRQVQVTLEPVNDSMGGIEIGRISLNVR